LGKRLHWNGLEVIHRIRPKIRHCYIQIEGDGSIVLKSPRISDKEALRIVEGRAGWIVRKLQELKGRERLDHALGEEVSYFGRLHRIEGNPNFEELHHAIGRLRSNTKEAFRRCYDTFYKKRAQEHVAQRLAHFERLCGRRAASLRIRKMKRRWGSCTGRGVITINAAVMRLPEAVIDYIIVHELSHLRHMNHSRAFYAEVERILPDYRTLDRELRRYQLG
jgi:predicted metal-dependent hydrolase